MKREIKVSWETGKMERTVFVVVVLVVVVRHVDVLVVELVLGLPRHLVLLLQPAAGVGEPSAHLKGKK